MIIPLMLNIALIRAHASQRPYRAMLSIAGVALGVLASVGIGTANIQQTDRGVLGQVARRQTGGLAG